MRVLFLGSSSTVRILIALHVGISAISWSRLAAAGDAGASCTLYHVDPQHLWNRLHDSLFMRVGPDGRQYGRDRLEPLLWHSSVHLLDLRTNGRVVALLEEFNRVQGEKLLDDSLKRAVLQRDLWLVANWLGAVENRRGNSPLASADADQRKKRLRQALVATIRRLALTADRIRSLSDNYAIAVASGEFAVTPAEESSAKPYLPPDLFSANGPWVCVGRPDGPIAPGHMQEASSNHFTNSAFLVFLRLPQGRAAAIDYLGQLRSYARQEQTELPDFPAGTELALVRRAMLIDSEFALVVSPLTESVQLRIRGNSSSFREFRLIRELLFSDRKGGLRSIEREERDFKTGFRSHAFDPFESPQRATPFDQYAQPIVLELCSACHRSAGVGGFNSLFNKSGSNTSGDDTRHPVPLTEVSIAESVTANVEWKQSRADWVALRKSLER